MQLYFITEGFGMKSGEYTILSESEYSYQLQDVWIKGRIFDVDKKDLFINFYNVKNALIERLKKKKLELDTLKIIDPNSLIGRMKKHIESDIERLKDLKPWHFTGELSGFNPRL